MPTQTGWVDEAHQLQVKDSAYNPPHDPDLVPWNVIHGYDEYDKAPEEQGITGTDKSGPYLVWWQCYPAVAVDPIYGW